MHFLFRLDKRRWRPFQWAKEDWLGQQRKGQVISTKGPPHLTVWEGGIFTTGLMLAIPDKVMRANKVKNILLVVEGLGGQKGKIHPKKGVAK